ncbi:E3 ubiquitin-protein ligase SINA-like 10 [Rhodamnia argentea]|uniref:RING-type E3 ubiquitin transferase n=1 Tax=Rhodamnia argentea TaxID=178133 RepID=A0A8B8PPW2_9MYRT|nr:E3 ubiquitin-protein ligase SINA-like 10 [Rhodamnia argentea]
MAKFSVDGEDDDDVPSTSSSGLGKRRRFPSSSHQSEQEDGSRRRRRRRPAKEEEEDRDSDIDRRDESNPSEEELEEQDRGRSVHARWYGDEYSYGRSWSPDSPPYGRTVGSLEVTLTDPDVFDCAVCLEPLMSPVFQCDNGHIACSSCCEKISNKCPSCSMPIGYNRCRAIEKVLESVQMACRNAKFGCNLKFGYHMKSDHEKTCPFAPCSCPFSSCNYIGSFRMLVKHFSTKHGASPSSFRFNFSTSLLINVETEVRLLKEEREDVLFVLKNEMVDLGSKIKICCIGPLPKAAYSYDIVANSRESSLKLHTCTKSVSDFECNPNLEPYLLVPREFFDDFLGLKFEVCIWRSRAIA